jgi:hypothetical protein
MEEAMSQANHGTTTSCDCAARPVAIFPPLVAAHGRLIAALASKKPTTIRYVAERADIEARGIHLDRVLAAVAIYVDQVFADTSSNLPIGALDRRYLGGLLADLTADIAGAIANAADTTDFGEV